MLFHIWLFEDEELKLNLTLLKVNRKKSIHISTVI